MTRKMTALVIGNMNYPGATLTNPINDSQDFMKAITTFGFSAILLNDCTIKDMEKAAKSFRDNLNSNDVGLLYFAGHGMQINGENYLTAIDTDFNDEISAKYTSFPLNRFIEIMEKANNHTNIIILDACRNNPYERAWNRSALQRGLAPVYAPKGTLIAFATSPGETASDGSGRNGSYTESLIRNIFTPDITIEEMFKRTRNTLSIITKQKQTSWEHTSLTGDFIFNVSRVNINMKYRQEAIADEMFIGDGKSPCHEVVAALKSHNWYVQNPSIDKFARATIDSCDINALFVVGRNIYQAACGNSGSADNFIAEFASRTARERSENREALLDGMLFEIFFGPKGELREQFKMSRFNEVFNLQKHNEFSASFDFIAESLIAHTNRFYVIPGKNRPVTVEVVSTKNDQGENVVSQVYFAGSNILRKDNSYDVFARHDGITYTPKRKEAFEDMISEEMVIPKRLLSINSNFKDDANAKILFPYSFTLSKG